ncbi:MAG: class I SAM-dependent methyltransferase [Flavobacteriales bacterium]|nr:class I SAM-dependent methyltransferase [Flavobacteriales bacterium]
MATDLNEHVGAYQGGNLYDIDNSILLNWYPQRIINQTAPSCSILELGVGHGYSTNIFSAHFQRHVVLDGSPAVIENFNQRYPECKAQIIETYFEEFDSEEKFDLIVMGFILEHVDNPIQILERFRNFLTPSGRMFIAVPNAASMNRRLGNIAGMLPDMCSLSAHDALLGHQRYYTVESLKKDIHDSGFSVVGMEGIYLKPLTTSQLNSLNLDKKLIDALCVLGIDYPELSCGIMAEIKNEQK